MKKFFLTIILILSIFPFVYAQWNGNPNIYYSSGNVGIGFNGPNSLLSVGGNASLLDNQLVSVVSYPTATTGSYSGIASQTYGNPSAAISGTYYGIFGMSGIYTGSTADVTNTQMGLAAFGGEIIHKGSGIVNSAAVLFANMIDVVGSGSITNGYGIYINRMKGPGVINGYGIYQTSTADNNYFAGNVGIGITAPQNKLDVNGTVHSKAVTVDMTGWGDYIFKKDYQLLSLAEVKTYINKNQHLPEIPSEQEIIKNGLNLGEMNKLLTKKVEELTLYMIQLKEDNERLKINQNLQQKQLNKLLKNKRSN